MTTPPPAPAPAPAPAPPAPQPPPQPQPPAPDPPQPPAPADDPAELRAALARERDDRKRLETELTAAKQAQMSETEKAIAQARAEGKAEAEQAAVLRVVAAEFRARAAGKLVNVEAALGMLDLAKLVKNGDADTRAIDALVAQLAAVPGPPEPPGRVPAGARQPTAPANGESDWLRQVRRSRG